MTVKIFASIMKPCSDFKIHRHWVHRYSCNAVYPMAYRMIASILAGAKPLSKPCWNIVNSNLRNKLKWNHRQNSFIFIQENAFEIVVCEMVEILYRPQCVKRCTGPCSWSGVAPVNLASPGVISLHQFSLLINHPHNPRSWLRQNRSTRVHYQFPR